MSVIFVLCELINDERDNSIYRHKHGRRSGRLITPNCADVHSAAYTTLSPLCSATMCALMTSVRIFRLPTDPKHVTDDR